MHPGPQAAAPPVHPGGAPPRGRRRWGRIVLGILLILFVALPVLAGGIVVLVGADYIGSFRPEARGDVPGSLSFDGGDERYRIALGHGIGRAERGYGEQRAHESEAQVTACTVTFADGTTTEVGGGRGADRQVQGTSYVEVADFDGKPGRTTVDCRFTEEADTFGSVNAAPFMVHKIYPRAKIIGVVTLLAGVALIGAGVLLILWGARRRPVASA